MLVFTNAMIATICLISFLLISGMTLFLFLNLRRNYINNYKEFLWMLVSIAVWTLFFMLETYFKTAEAKYICFRLQYFGMVYTLFNFILYVQKSIFPKYPPKRVQLMVMHALCVFFLVACLFNPGRLFVSEYSLVINDSGFLRLETIEGPLFYAFEAIVFCSFLSGIVVITVHYIRGNIVLKQATLVNAAIILPLAASLSYLSGLTHFDSTNLFLPMSALLLFISLSNFGMLDNVSFVKKNALSLLDMPLLILDNEGTVSFMNEAADKLFDTKIDARQRMTLPALGLPDELKEVGPAQPGSIIELDRTPKIYLQIRRHQLKGKQGHNMGALITMTNVTEQITLERHLEYVENHDSETGLMNAEMFVRLMQAYADQHKFSLAGNNVYAISIDNYLEIKSNLGAKAHSALLREVAEYLGRVINPYSILSRLSENEWGVFSCGVPLEIDAVEKLLKQSRRDSFTVDGIQTHVHFKLGLYRITDIDVNAEAALDCAQYALRAAEQSASTHIKLYDDHMARQHKLFKNVVGNLGRFDYSREFELMFQPIVDISSNRIVAAEALIRWNHPQFGRISPNRFIGVFERNGEIWRLGLFVIEKACEYIVKWKHMLSPDFCLSVNVSKKQIEHPELFSEIAQIVERYGVDPAMLELEVTETAAVDNIDIVKKFCSDVAAFGSGVSLDDFGSGNTTLGYITDFQLKKIKFDTNLTNEVDTNANKSVVAQSLLEMCNNLKLPIVVEHVETLQSLERFRAQGFKLIQGYVFSRPLSAVDFEKYYQNFHLEMR